MKENESIKCDVSKCKHNKSGCNCSLPCVKITCSNKECTCCDDYQEKKD